MKNEQRGNFYNYLLSRPWNGVPAYVGKGKGKRHLEHAMAGEKHENKRLANIYRKAKRLGMEVEVTILCEGLSEAESFATERALISALGRADKGEGPLVNLTDGGDGVSGLIRSAESRARNAEATKAYFANNPEARVRMSEKKKAWAANPIIKIKLSEIQKLAQGRSDVRARKSENVRARFADPEARARHTAALNRPDVRMRKSIAATMAQNRVETRSKMSEATKAYFASPGARARQSERMKLWHALRRQERERVATASSVQLPLLGAVNG